MKFVQNNKILVDSNAENAEIGAEKTQTRMAEKRTPALASVARRGSVSDPRQSSLVLLLCAYLCDLCASALNSQSPRRYA